MNRLSLQLPSAIAPDLAARGISLEELGFASVGWSRADALQVLAALVGGNIAVLGGDVLRREKGRLRNSVDNWYAERRTGESQVEFAGRSVGRAEQYLRGYPDPDDGTVVYVLVFDGGA